jgi:hypothetical protein
MEEFVPAKIQKGARYRVKQTFYASGVAVRAGTTIRVEWVNTHVEERVYQLDIAVTPIEPPGGTIIWGRTQPLEQKYLDEILEPVD